MYNFILQIIIMLSLGVMVYLIGRGTPRIKNNEASLSDNFHFKLDNLIKKIPFEKIDIFIIANLEKILRKIKLSLMKWDNLLASRLNKLKNISGNNLIKKEEKPHIFASPESVEDQSVIFDDIQNKEESNK